MPQTAIEAPSTTRTDIGTKIGQGLVLGLTVSLLAAYVANGFFALTSTTTTKTGSTSTGTKNTAPAIVAKAKMENVTSTIVAAPETPTVPTEYEKGIVYGEPQALTGCAQLTQADFTAADNAGQNITLDFSSGCYEIVDEDDTITFQHTLIVQGGTGSAYFTCNNIYLWGPGGTAIPGSTGIVVRDSSVVRDCAVRMKETGFILEAGGNPLVDDSSTNYGRFGFIVDSGEVRSSLARGTTYTTDQFGYIVSGPEANVSWSRAEDAEYGFLVINGGTVIFGTSVDNAYSGGVIGGFYLAGLGSVTGSTAQGGENGFMINGGTVQGNTALETDTGFLVQEYNGAASVLSNYATNNQYGFVIKDQGADVANNYAYRNAIGFHLMDQGRAEGATARANDIGFLLEDDAAADLSTANGNQYDGFYAEGGTISSSWATENGLSNIGSYGIRLLNDAVADFVHSNANTNGIYVGSTYPLQAKLRTGRDVCRNTGPDIYVEGGVVSGTFYVSKPIQGAGHWDDATFLSCPGNGGGGGGGGGGGSPIMLKPNEGEGI